MRQRIFLIPILSALSVLSCSRTKRMDFPGQSPAADQEVDQSFVSTSIALPSSGLRLTDGLDASQTIDELPAISIESAKGFIDGLNNDKPALLEKLNDRSFGIRVPRRFASAHLQISHVELKVDGELIAIAKGASAIAAGIVFGFDGVTISAIKRKLQSRITVRTGSAETGASIEFSGIDRLCFDPLVIESSQEDRSLVHASVKLGAGWSTAISSFQPASAVFGGVSRGGLALAPVASWEIDVDQLIAGENQLLLKLEDGTNSCELELVVEVEEYIMSSAADDSVTTPSIPAGFAFGFGDEDGTLLPEFQSMGSDPGVDLFKSCPERINLDGFADWQKIVLVDPANPRIIIAVECWVMQSFCINGVEHGKDQFGMVVGMTYEELTMPSPNGMGLSEAELLHAAAADCSTAK